MNKRMISGVVLAMTAMIAMGGCGVGKREYMNTAMSPALSAHAEPMPVWRVTPVRPAPIPREGYVLPPLYEPEFLDDRVEIDVRRNRVMFLARVANELQQLRHDLIRLGALANQKGAIGRATFDPKLRTFNGSVRLIDRYIHELRNAGPSEWDSLRVKIDVQMRDARNAVREAEKQLQRVHDHGHLLVAVPVPENLTIR